MNEIIREETKNLDINNLSKEDLKEILQELLGYYNKIEMIPLNRGSGNHIRLYPGLGIEKAYFTGESKPVDFNKVFEDIKKLTHDEKTELHNIYKNEECIARNLDMKAYFFDEMGSGDLYYLYEILFLKLFKHGYLNIKLFSFKCDKETKEGRNFFAFMDKYVIKTDNFHSSETGKTEFDLKTIVEKDYENFINLYLESITLKGDEYDDYYFSNRLDWVITIPSIKNFFIKLNSILSKYYEDNDFLRNDFINEINKSDNIIKISNKDYFNEKIVFYEYLKYLNDKNKLEINKVYEENGYLVFEIEKFIFNFDLLDLINFENKINKEGCKQIIYKYEFKDDKLYINGNIFNIDKSDKSEYFIKLISLYLSSNQNKKVIPIGELNDLYIKVSKDLKYLTLTANNIKTSYIKTINKQVGEYYSNNTILKIKGNDIVLM